MGDIVDEITIGVARSRPLGFTLLAFCAIVLRRLDV